MVNTDKIYTEVWNIIFKNYNFNYTVDADFFNNFIKGKNDSLFLNYLLPNLEKQLVIDISNMKDSLFIQLLKSRNENILLQGVLDFFEKNKNRRIAIVTSCNRKSALYILEYTGLNNYISMLIASEDCMQHKPNPEPYLNAIRLLNLNKDKTIIFEDSYSGYTSARNTNVFKIILISSKESCIDIRNANEYKIKDYCNFDIDSQIINTLVKVNPICDIIKNHLFSLFPLK